MDKLHVRVYNVRFGDAILVSVPDRVADDKIETRHILIDVGNTATGKGGDDVVFRPVIDDILKVLGGRPLDLYVMTHKHLDHVQGLLYAHKQLFPGEGLRQKLQLRHAWLTASAEGEEYYKKHPKAKERRDMAEGVYDAIRSFLDSSPERQACMDLLMMNNDPRKTDDCVDFLRNLTGNDWYVYRGFNLEGKHLFQDAHFEIWAPEEDTSVYYGRFHPMALGVRRDERAKPTLTLPTPPSGVDAGAFYNLVEIRRHGYVDNLLAIDAAANNTSVVFSLEWRGWRLLFTGDAEIRSWRTMYKQHKLNPFLKPVHFLKVSHHGSCNGMPPAEMLDTILPEPPPDNRHRRAVVSTYPGIYDKQGKVPDDETLNQLRQRCELFSTQDLADGECKDFDFEA